MKLQLFKGLTFSFLLMGALNPGLGQVYQEAKTQHRFAQTYLGLNTQIMPSSGELLWKGERRPFPALYSPRLTIGGMHFWGKVDFNINVPLTFLGNHQLDETSEIDFRPGAELSARYYPWRMEYGKVRPYAGISLNDMILEISDEAMGYRQELWVTTSLLGGLSYARNDWQVNAEVMWMPQTDREFYADQLTPYTMQLPSTYFSVGVVKYFEGTLHEEERIEESSALEAKLTKERKINTFSIGIAPSGSYFLRAPNYSDAARQSIARHKGTFNWEFGLGYLFHKPGIHVGLAFRDYDSHLESYGLEHVIRRQSLALEAFKYVWNMHGFRPYIGPSIGLERWATAEFDNDEQVGETQRTSMVSPGILFGWDIVPSPVDTWLLRTNLRYYPFQEVRDIEGKKSRVDQFEFNFIQLVIYPNRIYNLKRAKVE
ncbi:MAG TPA: hypothetical protein DCP28_12680 [Cytophagales bacterium]|nr:hypothetical protein [Cytophagales bacterium]